MTHDELIARLETESNGSRELDRAVQDVVVGFDPTQLPTHWPTVGDPTPAFTTSLDAALTLVPEDAWWSIYWVPVRSAPPPYASASVTTNASSKFVQAKTPVLAFCIAALKARKP